MEQYINNAPFALVIVFLIIGFVFLIKGADFFVEGRDVYKRQVHIREIYSLICKACSHGKPWLLCYLAKTQLTFLAHFVILKLHIWESSLTVRLSNPHMKK